MHENRRVLICIGDRPRNEKSLRFTRKVVLAYDCTPVLFHALSPGSPIQKGEKLLASANEILNFEKAEFLCVAGNARQEIDRELRQQEYQLAIVGTSERDPSLTPSPLSQHLANRVRTSALLIRNPPEEICQILICTGGHPLSENAIDWGIHLARATNNQVTILHVVSSPPTMYTGLDEIEENLSEVLARDVPLAHHLKAAAGKAEKAGVQAKLELRHGLVIEEIIRSAELEAHDLVILGAPQSSALFKRILLGRVAPNLLSSTLRSTLIVRGPLT